jgi:hypothetical protein
VHVAVIPIDLGRWDQARPADLLSVPIWSDVRPLRGAAGLLDWRLCGRLSALLAAAKVTGEDGEQLLLPSAGRLPFRMVLVSGLGRLGEFSEKRFRGAVRRTIETMRGLALTRLAVALPGREARDGAPGAIAARRALELALDEIEAIRPRVVEELTIIEPPAVQKELGEALRLRSQRRPAATRGGRA